MSFVFSIMDAEGFYGTEEEDLIDDAEEAIRLAVVEKKDIAVLDAFSLEYYGRI